MLPPHASEVTQPLDVGESGPFKSMYNKERQTYMQKYPGLTILKYQIAELTAKPYMKAVSTENLINALHKTGLHPFNNNVISDVQVAPSVIYQQQEANQPFTNEDGEFPAPEPQEVPLRVSQELTVTSQPESTVTVEICTPDPVITPSNNEHISVFSSSAPLLKL